MLSLTYGNLDLPGLDPQKKLGHLLVQFTLEKTEETIFLMEEPIFSTTNEKVNIILKHDRMLILLRISI